MPVLNAPTATSNTAKLPNASFRVEIQVEGVAEHIKSEVVVGLRQVDAVAVMREAAGIAKGKMESVLGTIKGRHAADKTKLISTWCNEEAKPLIRGVIVTHDKDHAEIDRIIAMAKAR